jgi:hypothetical protein
MRLRVVRALVPSTELLEIQEEFELQLPRAAPGGGDADKLRYE